MAKAVEKSQLPARKVFRARNNVAKMPLVYNLLGFLQTFNLGLARLGPTYTSQNLSLGVHSYDVVAVPTVTPGSWRTGKFTERAIKQRSCDVWSSSLASSKSPPA